MFSNPKLSKLGLRPVAANPIVSAKTISLFLLPFVEIFKP